MKTNNTPANVLNLLNVAEYVRNETIINGNQAAQLDAMTAEINNLTARLDEIPGKIAALATDGKTKAVAMWERMAERIRAQFADAVATLRAWLVDFKANRPGVQINIDEPEPEPTTPDNTPTTMNANETRTKSINGIMNQANRLMSVCNGARNFNRADAIREIAFRYYDNIRTCVGRFNYDDDSEYNKEYSRAQYMNA